MRGSAREKMSKKKLAVHEEVCTQKITKHSRNNLLLHCILCVNIIHWENFMGN